jgi:hypothetical protein
MTRRSLASWFALPAAFACPARSQPPAADDLTTIDSDGTAHIKRSVPVPKTISPETYALMVSGKKWTPEPGTKESADFVEKMHSIYPVEIEQTTVAGVKAKIVTPKRAAPRLAPQFPFPAAVDDTIAVYKDALKTHAPKKIGI